MNQLAKAGMVAVAGTVAIAIASASFFLKKDEKSLQEVVYRSGTDVPDPGKVGTPDKTIERGRELVALLRKSNWKITKEFPLEKLTVDDQRYAEFPQDRTRQTSFGIPKQQPPYEDVAVICDTYVRKNITAQRGGTSSQAPTGFFIVGFKDGRVEKVPVEQVRVKEYPMEGASTRRIGLLFPGTKGYDPNLPRF
jgi:hypothetical protein